MAFCGKCGAYIAEGSNVCPACGKRVGGPETEKKETKQQDGSAAQAKSEEYRRTYTQSGKSQEYDSGEYHYKGTPTGGYSSSEGPRSYAGVNTGSGLISGPFPLISVLSYFSFLFLIPYFVRNDSEFARFHANQGLVLLICNAVLNVAGALPLFGWLLTAAGWVFTVVCFFMGISNVLHKRFKELPIIGKIRLLK